MHNGYLEGMAIRSRLGRSQTSVVSDAVIVYHQPGESFMETPRSLEFDLTYLKQLIGAGLDGIESARREIDGGVIASPSRPEVWKPAAIGTTLGMLTTRLAAKHKSASRTAWGGLLGGVLGLSAGLAWASRGFISQAARTATRRVNATRDAHWLETHPIDYA
jgi:hypothetical protein